MPDRLLLNQGDGSFVDIAEAGGLGEKHVGSGATVGDYNGDGWLDIYVTSHGPPDATGPGQHRLYRNNGDLTFTNVAAASGVATTSTETGDGFGAAFGDYDLDGDLDLFVAGWVKDSQGNRLFRNNGDGTFDDVTEDAGILDDGIRGFSPCLADTNGDRYPEVLLVADFGTSRYFVNRRDGTFRERTTDSGTGQEWSGMGTAVGDFNRDGLIDWYTTAIFDDEHVGRGDGNKLYYNLGRHEFEEVAATSGVADGGWGWGAVAVDLDLDGTLDLVETNGWEVPTYTNELSKVWLAQSDGTFLEVGAAAGMDHNLFGLGVLHLDVDNDGDQDIGITTPNGEFRLYLTQPPESPHWLRVFLDTSKRPDLAPNGFGSKIRVTAGGADQFRWIVGCSSFSSQSELSAHFGLGDNPQDRRIGSVVARWVGDRPEGLGSGSDNHACRTLSLFRAWQATGAATAHRLISVLKQRPTPPAATQQSLGRGASNHSEAAVARSSGWRESGHPLQAAFPTRRRHAVV
jgi:hypothetical protein